MKEERKGREGEKEGGREGGKENKLVGESLKCNCITLCSGIPVCYHTRRPPVPHLPIQ